MKLLPRDCLGSLTGFSRDSDIGVASLLADEAVGRNARRTAHIGSIQQRDNWVADHVAIYTAWWVEA